MPLFSTHDSPLAWAGVILGRSDWYLMGPPRLVYVRDLTGIMLNRLNLCPIRTYLVLVTLRSDGRLPPRTPRSCSSPLMW